MCLEIHILVLYNKAKNIKLSNISKINSTLNRTGWALSAQCGHAFYQQKPNTFGVWWCSWYWTSHTRISIIPRCSCNNGTGHRLGNQWGWSCQVWQSLLNYCRTYVCHPAPCFQLLPCCHPLPCWWPPAVKIIQLGFSSMM